MPHNPTSDKKIGTAVRIFLILAILTCAGALASYWLFHPPRAERKPPQSVAALVETSVLHPADHHVLVRVMGTVIPAQRVDLSARVSGAVIGIQPNLLPGGRFAKSEEILFIDPADYELIVRQRRSDVARAEYELKTEMGKQSVARSEYNLLGEEISPENEELVLREPQLKAARAALEAARAMRRQAELDLARTRIVAPFNSLVEEKYVGPGSQVSVGTRLVTLIDTERYWVEASVPADRLAWIDIPGTNSQQGSPARLTHLPGWGSEAFRTGTVKSLLAAVDQQSRMAGLLVEVNDPLALRPENGGNAQLTINSFIHVEIMGKTLKKAFRVPRSCLHDGDKLWILSDQGTLDIRPVEVAWDENDTIYVTDNLLDGERLITSSLAAPVQDMALRTTTKDQTEQR